MYRAYRTSNLNLKSDTLDDGVYQKQAKQIRDFLQTSSIEGRIDGTKLREMWFPQNREMQVFISHSHKDVKTAIRLSNWLDSEFGIRSFIDSSSWLYSDDLLNEIDKKYCYNETSNTYEYEKRNGTTSHVHMMLASALSLMLDSCECAIFVDTPNSVSREDTIDKTESPWIMYEVNLMALIRTKTPSRSINFSEKTLTESKKMAKAFDIEYSLDLSSLRELSVSDFNNWHTKCEGKTGTQALDILYETY